MRTSTKLGMTALLAAMLLAASISSASARSFEVSTQRIRATWSRREFQSSVATVRCQITLEGSFHSRTIAKVANALTGAITRVDLKSESCSGGEARIRNETLPWHTSFQGFTGALPNITAIQLAISRFLFNLNILGIVCRYGAATDSITGTASINASREVTELRPVAGRNIATILEGRNPGELFGCPRSGNLVSAVGDGPVFALGTTNRITIRLI